LSVTLLVAIYAVIIAIVIWFKWGVMMLVAAKSFQDSYPKKASLFKMVIPGRQVVFQDGHPRKASCFRMVIPGRGAHLHLR
jgi:hypothetical protein